MGRTLEGELWSVVIYRNGVICHLSSDIHIELKLAQLLEPKIEPKQNQKTIFLVHLHARTLPPTPAREALSYSNSIHTT